MDSEKHIHAKTIVDSKMLLLSQQWYGSMLKWKDYLYRNALTHWQTGFNIKAQHAIPFGEQFAWRRLFTFSVHLGVSISTCEGISFGYFGLYPAYVFLSPWHVSFPYLKDLSILGIIISLYFRLPYRNGKNGYLLV